MLGLLAPVREVLQRDPVTIDNIIFRLHSRATVALLTACAILVTAVQYFGRAITCIPDVYISRAPINAYCWIFGTFTVSRHLNGTPGEDVASPGVGQATKDDEILYHRYYQWVYFVLTLQAILFYMPRALWGKWEAGIVEHLTKDLASPFPHEAWARERKRLLVEYFTVTGIHSHNFYALRFLFCELLNLINTLGQIYLMDVFLNGHFTKYGLAVATFAMETKPFERVDPMEHLFPKVTKCTFRNIGSSGTTQTLDAMCVLPLNIINEKVYVFIWFWFLFLATVSTLAVIYRITVFTQPWARIYLIRATTRVLSQTKASTLVMELHFGDWFLLHQLAHNVNPFLYKEIVNEIVAALEF